MNTNVSLLVTGAAGFIGSNLANRLASEGYKITCVDDLSNGDPQFITHDKFFYNFYKTDFADERILQKIRRQEFDYVFHLAALPRVSFSVEHPLLTHDTNVTKTMKLIDACKGNIKRFVFSSSSSVYGGCKTTYNGYTEPSQESDVRLFGQQSPYALQKLIIEQYLQLYEDLYQFDYGILRYFNVFGPHSRGDSPYSTAVGAWLDAIKNNKPLRSDGDGTQTRDMCYVDNVVAANILAMKATTSCFTCNVGCGESISNNEILEILRYHFPNLVVEHAPKREGDVQHTLADITRSKSVLNYEPQVKFVDGLMKTIEWYMNDQGKQHGKI